MALKASYLLGMWWLGLELISDFSVGKVMPTDEQDFLVSTGIPLLLPWMPLLRSLPASLHEYRKQII